MRMMVREVIVAMKKGSVRGEAENMVMKMVMVRIRLCKFYGFISSWTCTRMRCSVLTHMHAVIRAATKH